MHQRTLSGERAPATPFRDEVKPPRRAAVRAAAALADIHQYTLRWWVE